MRQKMHLFYLEGHRFIYIFFLYEKSGGQLHGTGVKDRCPSQKWMCPVLQEIAHFVYNSGIIVGSRWRMQNYIRIYWDNFGLVQPFL